MLEAAHDGVLQQVTFTDGNDVRARVMGVDEDKDLAVLFVDPSQLGTEAPPAPPPPLLPQISP